MIRLKEKIVLTKRKIAQESSVQSFSGAVSSIPRLACTRAKDITGWNPVKDQFGEQIRLGYFYGSALGEK
jgi:hypothetical protein